MPKKNKNKQTKVGEGQSPPQTEKNVMVSHKYYFQSATNNQVQITTGMLLSAFGAMATGANTVNLIFKAVRVKRIRIWTSPVTLGIALTNGVEWLSLDSGVMTTEFRDTSNSPNRPAYIDVKPTQSTAAWFWRSISSAGGNSTVPLFNIVAPTGSVVEVTMTGIMSDVAFTNFGYATTAAATVGEIYYGGLDGIGTGTGLLVPLGLQSIV
jgi:hypothetical protein